MKLGFDLRIMRYPPGGTAAYARIAMERMAQHQPVGWEIVGLDGWRRLDHGSSMPAPIRRTANLALDMGWLTLGAPFEAARRHLDAWFTPASLLPLTLPRPTVTIMHNLAFLLVPDLFEPGYRRATERLHRLAATRATRIITPSDFLRGVVIDRLGAAPDRVRTIPWGIDHLPTPAETTGIDLPRPYALFIGQTQPHWNTGVLLDAWRAGVPDDLALVISGAAGRDDAFLRRRVDREGLAGRVHFTGLLPADRLMAVIRDAHLFIDPSLAEGFGKPVLEAMLLGVPSGASTEGALPEVTQGAALLFDAKNPEAVADAVTRLHGDQDLRQRLHVEGPRVASQLRWARSAQGYWEEVTAAVAERAS